MNDAMAEEIQQAVCAHVRRKDDPLPYEVRDITVVRSESEREYRDGELHYFSGIDKREKEEEEEEEECQLNKNTSKNGRPTRSGATTAPSHGATKEGAKTA